MPEPPASRRTGPARLVVPHEVPADRAAELEAIAGQEVVDEIRRDLAVVDPLDGQLEPVFRRCRRDGVAALCLVAVLRREPDVDVLTGPVAAPAGDVEHERPRSRRFRDGLDRLGGQPGQSPQYRCSSHGSPRMW